MLSSEYELNTTTHFRVIAIFIWIRYMKLSPSPLIFWPGSHVAWCHMYFQSLYKVCTVYDIPF